MAVLGLRCCIDFFYLLCTGFFLRWLLVAEHGLWGMQASVATAHGLGSCSSQALEHRLNSCDAQA